MTCMGPAPLMALQGVAGGNPSPGVPVGASGCLARWQRQVHASRERSTRTLPGGAPERLLVTHSDARRAVRLRRVLLRRLACALMNSGMRQVQRVLSWKQSRSVCELWAMRPATPQENSLGYAFASICRALFA